MNNDTELKETNSGPEVVLYQRLLRINSYYPGSITGVFGPDTVLWTKKFQEDNNLNVTGTATLETWEYLYEITNPAIKTKSTLNKPVLQIGDTGSEVTEVQTMLKSLGYYNGELSGMFNELTYEAVQSFQFINKLVPEGIVGPDTWSALIYLYSPLADCDVIESSYSTYTVKSGDTLYSIATLYETTVDNIKGLNNLTSNSLSIGQKLKVPLKNSDSLPDSTYTVQKGDTLYAISKRFNITLDEIRKLNNLTSDILTIGQVLKVSNDSYLPDIPNPEIDGVNFYTVKAGDTLYSIAKKYGVTVDSIRTLNNLSSDILTIGQELKITNDTDEPNTSDTYTVQKGDTLYSIARKFNTTVDEIRKLNNLTSDILSIGQVLNVSDNTDDYQVYIVQSGDTLYGIASKFNTTVNEIIAVNQLTNTLLSIGQTLMIP